MSGGHRKYNIWIAYSDLFTNLSTFLFISALGVFAAIGSGKLIEPGVGGATVCSAPPGLLVSFTEQPNLLEYAGHGPSAGGGCAFYFKIKAFKFQSSVAGLGEFQDKWGVALSRPRLLAEICQPIWLTLPRRDFVAGRGRITFVGNGSANNGWRYQPECERISRREPKISHPDFPRRQSPSDLVRTCDRLGRGTPLCRDILDCGGLPAEARNTLCQEVQAVRDWMQTAPAACRRETAHSQAKTIYGHCELAHIETLFPDHRFDDDEVMIKGAGRVDIRSGFWGRVDYSGVAEGPLAQSDGGSVWVKVQFEP